jgi:hypothetical protein
MTASRTFGVFAIVFAVVYPIVYVIATEVNLALFTYHPALGEFGLGPNAPRNGPAMYWFGWMMASALCALVAAAIAAYLPERLTKRLPATLAWLVPLAGMVAAAGLMTKYFVR